MRCPFAKVLVDIAQSFHSRATWGGWPMTCQLLRLVGLGFQSEGVGRQGDGQSPPGWPVLVGCGTWPQMQCSHPQPPLGKLFGLACSPFLEEVSVWVVCCCC